MGTDIFLKKIINAAAEYTWIPVWNSANGTLYAVQKLEAAGTGRSSEGSK